MSFKYLQVFGMAAALAVVPLSAKESARAEVKNAKGEALGTVTLTETPRRSSNFRSTQESSARKARHSFS